MFLRENGLNTLSCHFSSIILIVFIFSVKAKEGENVASKEQRQRKQFAEMLLRVQGVEYDDWLDEKHRAVIEENQELVMKGLQAMMNSKTSETSNHNNDYQTGNTTGAVSSETNY